MFYFNLLSSPQLQMTSYYGKKELFKWLHSECTVRYLQSLFKTLNFCSRWLVPSVSLGALKYVSLG